jgi:transcriptional regulator with XRE-family HTH domain
MVDLTLLNHRFVDDTQLQSYTESERRIPMEQVKIGKFIADCRRRANLTQMQLAEKLGITDRAVSKWETGKALPDSSIMLELCGLLGITVNDLLSGEVISVENYNEEMEKKLIQETLKKHNGKRSIAAKDLRISERTLYRKIKTYGLE